jgi:hypothetical protein
MNVGADAHIGPPITMNVGEYAGRFDKTAGGRYKPGRIWNPPLQNRSVLPL